MPKEYRDWTEHEKLRYMHGGSDKWNSMFPTKHYDPEIMAAIDREDELNRKIWVGEQMMIEDRLREAKKAAQEQAARPNYAVDPYTRYATMVGTIHPNLRPSPPSWTHEAVDMWAKSNAHLFGTNGSHS